MTDHPLPHWPYPRWIAHRGAGKLAPENTLAAFRLGAAHGYRMYECDVKLSADGVPFLLHDATLDRTTNGHGTASDLTWEALNRLDAGGWHSPRFAEEPLPTLADVVSLCQAQDWLLNIEIKPTPGQEAETGRVVALMAQALWLPKQESTPHRKGAQESATPPLLTSFQPESLAAAQAAAPLLPRGLLLDTLREGWLASAQRLGCVAIICQHTLWNAKTVAQAQAVGMRTLSYTVNDTHTAERLWTLGLDGIITDRVDLFTPD